MVECLDGLWKVNGQCPKRDNRSFRRGQRVEFVGNVQERDDEFEAPRPDRAAYVFCVHSCKNFMSECPEVPKFVMESYFRRAGA